MKHYKVYVLKEEGFKYIFGCSTIGRVTSFVTQDELRKDFIAVESYTYNISHPNDMVLVKSTIYLGGVLTKTYRHSATPSDIERLKKKLTTIFHVDGTRTYLPDLPITTPEVMGITHGWSSMSIVKDHPQRWAILYFDIKQYDIDDRPKYNHQASKKFSRNLYGDVLYVNEKFVS